MCNPARTYTCARYRKKLDTLLYSCFYYTTLSRASSSSWHLPTIGYIVHGEDSHYLLTAWKSKEGLHDFDIYLFVFIYFCTYASRKFYSCDLHTQIPTACTNFNTSATYPNINTTVLHFRK